MPLVPTPPDFDSGITSSTQWNQVRDAVKFLQRPPIAELRQSSVQSIPNSTVTALTFGAEDYDSDVDATGGHDNVTNNSRYTARYPGWYEVAGGVTFAANATNHRLCWWRINGTDVNGTLVELGAVGGGAVTAFAARTKHVYLALGDYVELVVFQNSGGALNTSVTTTEQSNMTVRWVSS